MKETRTLFIRNIPYSFSNDKLEDRFSEFGPVKQCFIVNDKVTGKSRGFGYIKFTDIEDAKRVKESSVTLDGRRVIIDYADISKKIKRPPKKKTEKEDREDSEMSPEPDQTAESSEDEQSQNENKQQSPAVDTEGSQKSGKNLKYHRAKIVSLTGLPEGITDTELNNCVLKMGVKQVAECKLLSGGKSAHLKFKCIRDAKRAIRKLHNHAYKDCMLQAVQMSKDTASLPQNILKKSRVIVRNLAFQCSEDQLRKAFQGCGDITEVKIPANEAGKKLGFGFVQFSSLHAAQKAVEMMNAQKICGRPVAVDWALPKAKYESTQQKKDMSEESEDEGSFSAESDLSSDEQQTSPRKQKQQQTTKTHQRMESSDDGIDDDDEEDAEENDEDSTDDSDSDDVEGESKQQVSDTDDDEGKEEEEGDNSENDSDEDDSDSAAKGSKEKKKHKMNENARSDTDDGCTLFVRNLSFDSTEDDLEEYFKQFGELKYAKVVINPDTEHSKGMGFVRFTTKDSADACLRTGEEGKLSLGGRQLLVTVAVSRERAAGYKDKKEKEKKDNRNLYLAREGMIRPGTQAAEGLSQADLDKRMKVEQVKRQKLKNVNIFISPLRLCIRNIPVSVDDAQLKAAFKNAAEDPRAKVTECRIMRDRARTNAEGKGKSMGYGFVSFTDHQHALTALRKTNNNPEIFGDKKRLIVEFSLENRKALEAKERRKEKMKHKVKSQAQNSSAADRHVQLKKQTTKSPKIPLLQLSEKDKKLKGDKVVKGLPSHWGPKIRHKPRQSQDRQKKKEFRKNKAKKRKNVSQQSEGPVVKKPKKMNPNDVSDNFDKMVSKYKNKLLSNKRTTKWFE